MAPTLKLGRIFGIEIGLNWSLLFIFALVAWTLGATVLPQDVPGRPAIAYVAGGVAGGLLFYVGLLAHELSHALMARNRGVKVSGITLWLFGGVSRLDGEPPNAWAEALITAVGPLTSFALAAVFYATAVALGASGPAALPADVAFWLAYFNGVLGIFNLVPAFPLDGGRLLAAFFWWRSGGRATGVHRAVQVGRWFAYLMIGYGAFELFTGAFLSGIWIAFIGWFLLTAAAAEEAGASAVALLRGVPVSAAMSSPAVTFPEWLTVEAFLGGVASAHRFTTYPLQAVDGRVTGVVRLPALLRVPPGRRGTLRLSELATPVESMPVAAPGADLASVLQQLGGSEEGRVLVMDDGRLVGIVSPADIARLLTFRRYGSSAPGVAA